MIDLQKVGMTTCGLRHLVGALSAATTTVSNMGLILSNNRGLGNTGAELLAQLLQSVPTIRKIWIDDIGMGKDGAQCLSQELKHNNNLEYLSFGEMSEGPTNILLSSLLNNHAVRAISLCQMNNTNPDDGLAQSLVEVLQMRALHFFGSTSTECIFNRRSGDWFSRH